MDRITSMTFLNEPAGKWLVFLVMLMLFLIAWHGVMTYIKE